MANDQPIGSTSADTKPLKPKPSLISQLDTFVFFVTMPALCWYWLFALFFNKFANEDLFYCPAWFLILVALAFIWVRYAKGSWWWVPGYALILFIFPLMSIVLLHYWVSQLSDKLKLCWTVLLYVSSIWVLIVVLPLLFCCWYIIAMTSFEQTRVCFIVVNMVLNALLLLIGVRLAADPLHPLLSVLAIWEKLLGWIERKNAANLKLVAMQLTAFHALEKIYDDILQRRMVPIFSTILILMYLVTVFGYGVSMLGAQRLSSPAFAELSPSLSSTIPYSLSVLTTSPISNVLPLTTLGRWMYAAELGSTFLIVTVFFAMFSASISVHGPNRREEQAASRTRIRNWLAEKARHFQHQLEELPPPGPPQ